MTAHSGKLVPRAKHADHSRVKVSIPRTIAEKVVGEKTSILTNNVFSDSVLDRPIVSSYIRSAMCVPLWDEDTVGGLIYVDRLLREKSFDEDDLTLLTCLANLAAIKLKNFPLLADGDC